jgi:hypothetical protein
MSEDETIDMSRPRWAQKPAAVALASRKYLDWRSNGEPMGHGRPRRKPCAMLPPETIRIPLPVMCYLNSLDISQAGEVMMLPTATIVRVMESWRVEGIAALIADYALARPDPLPPGQRKAAAMRAAEMAALAAGPAGPEADPLAEAPGSGLPG